MKDMSCEAARETIPDVAAGRPIEGAERVARHVEACADCRAELELARMLYAGRPDVPVGLSERIIGAARRDRRAGGGRPVWGVAAAAVVAVALGIGIVSERGPSAAGADVPSYAYEVEEGAIWASEDGLVAGAPSFDALSEEALRQLLDELSVGGAGGAV